MLLDKTGLPLAVNTIVRESFVCYRFFDGSVAAGRLDRSAGISSGWKRHLGRKLGVPWPLSGRGTVRISDVPNCFDGISSSSIIMIGIDN